MVAAMNRPLSSPATAAGGRRTRHLILTAFVAALGACGKGERDTLLALDVVMPAHPITSLAISVGDSEHRMVRPATFPPVGQVLGIDLRLPRALAGRQIVALVARDAHDCHVAFAAVEVELVPGEKVGPRMVELEELVEPVCDANGPSDAGASADADADVGDADLADGGSLDAAEELDALADASPDPVDGSPADGMAPDDGPAGDTAAPDARPPVDGPPPVPHCDGAGHCAAGLNCIADNVCAAATSCAQIKTQKPGAADGVYWVKVGAAQQQVYCDMRIGAILCSTVRGEHAGKTRIGPEVPFKLSSELDVGAGTCRIWAVRHAVDGYPFDKIDPPSTSTCQALGFKPGDGGFKLGASINRSCPYGSNPSPYSDCGFGGPDHRFGGRGFYKWGNTCKVCTPVITATGYFKQGPVFASDIYWDMSGRVSNFCGVR
jgi:hypothetical protein